MKIDYPKGILVDDKKKESSIGFEQKELVDIKAVCLNVKERGGGAFKNHAFFLSSDFKWIIIEDEWYHLCLIPLKKT